jgi:excisionase family DNA binding protein
MGAPEDDPPSAAPRFFTIAETAKILRFSARTVRRRIKSGGIVTVPLGGRLVRISADEIARLAAGEPLPEPPTEKEVEEE